MGATLDLFPTPLAPATEALADGAVILRRFVRTEGEALLEAVGAISKAASFRQMKTPGGRGMSAAMTNAGPLGWVSDLRGYRYASEDPETGLPWPSMPELFLDVARRAALTAGFPGFVPDACLVNHYVVGARMGLHQDRDERDFAAPIVSVSLGLPCVFLFGGATRAGRPSRVLLEHGDVVVFGGPARRYFHGVAPIADGVHPLTGPARINLTFRKAR